MIKIFKNFFYFTSLILLIVILLRLNHFDQIFSLKAHLYYKKYYLICFVIFTFGFLSNFIKKSYFLNLSLVIISILFGLYSFESILYINEVLKRGDDKRSIIKVYKDQKKNLVITNLYLYHQILLDKHYDLLPLSQKSNTWIVDCNELGYYPINKSDRYGFNNDDKIWDNKHDIIFIGDSFVYGFCVNRNNNMASIISKLTNKNILNLGMPANGFFLNYASFKEFADKQNLNSIIWFINDMDFMNFEAEFNNPFLRKYLSDPNFKQNLKNKTSSIDIIIDDLFKKRFEKMPFQKFAKLQRTKTFILFNLKLSKYDQKDFDKIKISNNLKINIEKIFSNFNENINSNTKVFIAHLPLKNKYIDRNYNDQFKKLTKLYAKKFNFQFIDLEKSYPKEADPIIFYSKKFWAPQ